MNSTKQAPVDTVPVETLTAGAPESIGHILTKLGIVWTGLFAGWTLGEVVLMATLIYTILQIVMLVVERIIKPILAARKEAARISTFGD